VGLNNFKKFNDLAGSTLRKKLVVSAFVPETNIAVGFGRVSIQKNKDKGQSDVDQFETNNNYAELENLVFDRTWDVAETAAKHDKRKNFIEMLEYVRNNSQIKHVVFSHQSRSNRNRISAKELESLLELGVTIHFPRDNFRLNQHSSIEDWLRWDIFNSLNAKFIDDHKKNVAGGMVKRIEMGLFPGKAPYGYRNFRPTENSLSYFIFDSGAKEYMESAFELFATGLFSWKALEAELRCRFPSLEKKLGWTDLAKQIKNPFYYGDFSYDGEIYKGNPEFHPPLVTFSLWQACQEVLKRPDRTKRKVTLRNHPYIGLIRCSGHILDANGDETTKVCGWLVTGEEKRKTLADGTVQKYYYWRCSNRKKPCSQRDKEFLNARGREKIYYGEAEIEALLANIFTNLKFPPETVTWMQDCLLKHHGEKKGEDQKERSGLQTRYEMLSRYVAQAYEDKLKGDLDEISWRERNANWRVEQEGIRIKLASLEKEDDAYIENGVMVIELLQRAESIFKNARPEIKRRLAEIVGSNYRLRDGTLEFDYRKPFDILAKTDENQLWWRKGDLLAEIVLHLSCSQLASLSVILAA
jgi:hypothetical protein